MKTTHVAVLAFLFIFYASMALAAPDINPGLWEITAEIEMSGVPGMEGMTPPPQTYTQCLTEEDLVPRDEAASQDCEITDVEEDGDTVSWRISCSGEGRMEGSGWVTYTGDSMEGETEASMPDAGMQVTTRMSGYRIGDCD
jgi:hypothetical protein